MFFNLPPTKVWKQKPDATVDDLEAPSMADAEVMPVALRYEDVHQFQKVGWMQEAFWWVKGLVKFPSLTGLSLHKWMNIHPFIHGWFRQIFSLLWLRYSSPW